MNALWEFYMNYEPAMRTFVGIGAFSSLVLFIQMIVILIGGSDLDFELGEVGEGGATGIFSIRSIGSFFTGFGWTGAMLLQNGHIFRDQLKSLKSITSHFSTLTQTLLLRYGY